MKKFIYTTLFLFLVTFSSRGVVFAADISCVADKNTVTENQTFTVSVYTDTRGANINNSEGVISFPTDLLTVESVNSNGSIFSIWVEQPTFSNTKGIINFNGGIPTPGYIGTKGKIVNIFFKAKKSGVAKILFSSANVYANDGMGTDVTSLKNGTTIIINPIKVSEIISDIIPKDTPAITTTLASGNLPAAPVVASIEMPDEESWYSLNTGTFSWKLPSGVTTVQLLLNNSSDSTPSVTYSPGIEKKELKNLTDGIHYLHVRFKNSAGWGKTTHRKIKIDTISPSKLEVASSISVDDLISLRMTAEDKTSGLDKYKVSIDGVLTSDVNTQGGETNISLPPTSLGNHDIGIVVYDKAGNLSEKVMTLEFPKIKSPEITKYPESIKKGEQIEILGNSYPNTDIRIWLQSEGGNPKSYLVKTLDDKTFSFISLPVDKSGTVTFWAEALLKNDTISPPSLKYIVIVNRFDLLQLNLFTAPFIPIYLSLLLLLLILLYIAYLLSKRNKKSPRKIVVDLEQTEDDIHRVFRIIKEDVKQSFRILKDEKIKNKLSVEDVEVFETLTKDIAEAEDYFIKKIKNIERNDL